MKLLDLQDWFESVEVIDLLNNGAKEVFVKLQNRVYKITPGTCNDCALSNHKYECEIHKYLNIAKLPARFSILNICFRANEYMKKRKETMHHFKFVQSLSDGI